MHMGNVHAYGVYAYGVMFSYDSLPKWLDTNISSSLCSKQKDFMTSNLAPPICS